MSGRFGVSTIGWSTAHTKWFDDANEAHETAKKLSSRKGKYQHDYQVTHFPDDDQPHKTLARYHQGEPSSEEDYDKFGTRIFNDRRG